jgi:hypothetical protein
MCCIIPYHKYYIRYMYHIFLCLYHLKNPQKLRKLTFVLKESGGPNVDIPPGKRYSIRDHVEINQKLQKILKSLIYTPRNFTPRILKGRTNYLMQLYFIRPAPPFQNLLWHSVYIIPMQDMCPWDSIGPTILVQCAMNLL